MKVGIAPLLLLLTAPIARAEEPDLRTGDVVFQTSRSRQSIPIQRATNSPWSHVGVVERTAKGIFVIEAIQPVSRTPWEKWRKRGEGGRVRAMRAPALDAAKAGKVVAAAKRYLGRPYDRFFRWDDGTLYCSELVVKAFAKGAGLELGKRQSLGELAIEGLEATLRQRFGAVPRDLVLITPASIAADEDLGLVGEWP